MLKNKIVFLISLSFLFSQMVFANPSDPNGVNKEKRIALIIGNNAYEFGQLENAVNDAKAISKALEELNFQVDKGINLDRDQIQEKIENFKQELKTADVAMFYFAGHGVQISGKNFLVPLVKMQKTQELMEQALEEDVISTEEILHSMDEAGNAINIVILDACRNNPFSESFNVKSSGLANLKGPTSSLIAYSTAPGKVAADGKGENGLYTQHLLEQIAKPGVNIEYIFKKVRHGVITDSSGQQVPWESSSLIDDFYFIEPNNPVHQAINIKLTHETKNKELELAFWKSIEDVGSALLYNAYLEKYPKGNFAEIAKIKLKETGESLNKASEIKSSLSRTGALSKNEKTSPPPITDLAPDNLSIEAKKIMPPQFKPGTADVVLKKERLIPEIEMVKINQGCFTMGSPFGEDGRQNDELDHEVCLTQDYWLANKEVTQGLWKGIMGRNPSYFKSCGKKCPVERVSWNDVQVFLKRLNNITGQNYRLPTEAEWEYAARAETTTSTYAGEVEWIGENNAEMLEEIAWYSGNTGVSYKGGKYCEDWDEKQYESIRCGIQKVASKQANAWGIYDMIGNVRELTQDWYGAYSSKQNNDPKGPKKGSLRVARGGDWSSSLDHNRAAARYGFSENERSITLGFRLAR